MGELSYSALTKLKQIFHSRPLSLTQPEYNHQKESESLFQLQ